MLQEPKKECFLRIANVMVRTGLSRSSIYLGINKGTFPKAISIGSRSVAWLESDVDAWVQTQIDKRKEP